MATQCVASVADVPLAADSLDEALVSLLIRARSGCIHSFGAQGPDGSKGWRAGQPPPRTLLLHDLSLGTLPVCFGASVAFATVTELDLSGNRLIALPDKFCSHLGALRVLYLGGPEGDPLCNKLACLPQDMSGLTALEHLSLHDNALKELPPLSELKHLETLRLDRNPLECLPTVLPPSLKTLHLEGCSLLGGSIDDVWALPPAVRSLEMLEDLQLPDGCHVGTFFGTPLPEILRERAADG
eukprot:TRINITY_DN42027_c0_g1_i1.p1 TRINITY_DN42027_c0_g1~~TRINITY_DN42027_c0_g1_i1.p1  ORF type:complete len:241 (+),score=30.25 TRINITY_DN42027_c0_g1_i1:159-881(+)